MITVGERGSEGGVLPFRDEAGKKEKTRRLILKKRGKGEGQPHTKGG